MGRPILLAEVDLNAFVLLLAAAGCSSKVFEPSGQPTPIGGEDASVEEPEVDPDPEDTAVPEKEEEEDLPSEYSYEPEPNDAEPLPVEQVEAKLREVVNGVRELNAEPIFAAFERSMALASGTCPGGTTSRTKRNWRANCTTPGGTLFDGNMNYTYYEEGSGYHGDILSGDGQVQTASGSTFRVAGGALNWWDEQTRYGMQYEEWYSYIAGTFSYDGTGSTGSWTTSGITPNLTMTFGETREADARWGSVGGVMTLSDPDFGAVSYGDLQVWNEAWGAECWAEPQGMIALRGNDGYWYEATFHGGTEDTDLSLCDGCADLEWRGEVLGEVCVDFSDWLAWSGNPW